MQHVEITYEAKKKMKFIKIKREENNPKFFKKRETKGCWNH